MTLTFTLCFFLAAFVLAVLTAGAQLAEDHDGNHDWAEWRAEVRHNGLRWVNGKTGEVITAEEMDQRSKASVIIWHGGGR